MTEQLQLGEVTVILKRSRRRSLSIEVSGTGVTARAPNKMSLTTIQEFLSAKQKWIHTQLSKVSPTPPPLKLKTGTTLHVLGDAKKLSILNQKRAAVTVTSNELIVPVHTASHLPEEERVRRKLIKWYKTLALSEFEQRVQCFSNQMHLQNRLNGLKVYSYKRRWGSCDQQGRLAFSWRLAQAPSAILDYVAIHELAHLREFNHSPRFWSIVEQHMPGWQQHRQWLDQNGAQLYRF